MHIKSLSHWRLTLTTTLLLGSIVLCGCPKDESLTLIANLTSYRQTVEAYVKQIKQNFQPNDPVYLEAKQRYLTASSLYEGYVTAVRISIQTGMHGDLQSLAVQAEAKSTEFVTYAGDNLHSRSLLSLLPELTLASVASYIISVRNDQRTKTANVVYQEIRWKPWDAII
jgi:hypothetical protein